MRKWSMQIQTKLSDVLSHPTVYAAMKRTTALHALIDVDPAYACSAHALHRCTISLRLIREDDDPDPDDGEHMQVEKAA